MSVPFPAPEESAETDRTDAPTAGTLRMPVETEIYILPTGEVIVADMPRELDDALGGRCEPSAFVR